MRLGGIEAGGTKMVCGICDESGNVLDRISIPTLSPDETIPLMIDYFKDKKIDCLGIGSFGPINLDENSLDYGKIMRTPKKLWEGFDFVKTFENALNVPVGLDTDVNAAIYGEVTFGAAKGTTSAIYITIGTGVGVGVYVNGALLHGLVHPEAGHILIDKLKDDTKPCACAFHKNCLEGLASGTAIKQRYGVSADKINDNQKALDETSYYIANAIASYILTYSPQRIILWGGVMHNDKLKAMIGPKVKELLNGYVMSDMIDNINDYIVDPLLGDNPGLVGAALLGLDEIA